MRGGANFLSPSTKFGELHRHKQSSTSVKNACIGEDWTGVGAVSVASPPPGYSRKGCFDARAVVLSLGTH